MKLRDGRTKWIFGVAAVVALWLAMGGGVGAQAPAGEGQIVPDQYIVVFTDDVRDPPGLAHGLARAHGGSVLFTYEYAIKGFAAQLPAQAAEAISRNPNVAYVEPDRTVRLFDTQMNPPSWGLDRVDQREPPLDGVYNFGTSGAGVNVYILDTGIRDSHSDFGGRVQSVNNDKDGDFVGDTWGITNGAEDCHGHGTHVAGTAGGLAHGVAKSVTLWRARVVDCFGSGTASMAIAAVDWVTAYAVDPAVVNMSLGYGDVQSLRDAVENSIASGINYAVAAGNGNFVGIPQDACNQSPAGAPNALTVGATDIDDDEASFSNYGTCVDLLAPGVSIISDCIGGDNATCSASGTSMATPHVAGAVALFLEANPLATPTEVAVEIKNNATMNEINLHRRSNRNGTPNLLLYTAFIAGAPAPPPTLLSISVTPGSASIEQWQTQQFTATGSFDDGSTADLTSTATWASSDTAVATIDASGLATGVSVGTSNITASQDGVDSNTATLDVTAPPPPPTLSSITVAPSSASIEQGQTQQFTATGTFSDGSSADVTSTATWASSDTAVATIDASGLATGDSVGTSVISASQDGVISNTAALEVTPPAATDAVTITKAQYRTRPRMLQVEAESTDATAVLTAFDADTNALLGVLVDGKLNIKISPSPANVRVDSDKGGSATMAVD